MTRTLSAKLPFYGWFMAGMAMIATFSSGPGQSYVFSVFVDSILADTGLSRTEVSTLYAIGTGVSALTALTISRLVDRFGPRIMLSVIAVLFGAACFVMAGAIGPLMVLIGFAALRALGQGSLPVTATLLTAQWFVRYRGRAMAMVSLGFAASNALFPPVSRFLIEQVGWRDAYRVLGVAVWLLIIPAAALLVRNRPEALGLHPDGLPYPPENPADRVGPGEAPVHRNVWRTRAFWLLALPLTAGPFVATALVFHQASLFAERGLSADVAASVFVPFALASAGMTAVAGFAIERFGPKRVLFGTLLLLMVATLELLVISSPIAAIGYGLTLGCATGAQSVVSGTIWAHYYGRRGLGSVQGAAALVLISGSALAPLPLAAMHQATGDYTLGLLVFALIPLACTILLALFHPPQRG